MKKKKTTKKKPGKKLIKVTSPVKPDAAYFVASELADDKLVEKEILGQATKTMVYEYENEDGEKVHGLSYQGVREAVRLLNRMRDSGHRIQITDKPPIINRDIEMHGIKGVEVQIYAMDVESGGGSWGMKFEPWRKFTDSRQEDTEENRFALEQALSKAQRNALFNLLPADLIENTIAKFVKDKEAIETIEAPKETAREVKPQASNDNKMYDSTLARVGKIKDNKKALEQALKNVDNMPISGKQRGQIRRKISNYIKKIAIKTQVM